MRAARIAAPSCDGAAAVTSFGVAGGFGSEPERAGALPPSPWPGVWHCRLAWPGWPEFASRSSQGRPRPARGPLCAYRRPCGVLDVSSVEICGKLDVFQQVMVGCPYPAFADAKPGEAVINLAGLVTVGIAVHPCLDRVAVLRRRDAQGDQRRKLRQYVLVKFGRALRYAR